MIDTTLRLPKKALALRSVDTVPPSREFTYLSMSETRATRELTLLLLLLRSMRRERDGRRVQRRARLCRGGQRDRRRDRARRRRGREGRDVHLLRELPRRERRLLQALVHAQVVVRRDRRLGSNLARSAPHPRSNERRVTHEFQPEVVRRELDAAHGAFGVDEHRPLDPARRA